MAHLLLPIVYCLGLIPLVRAGPVEGVSQLLFGLSQVVVIIIQFITDMILDINSVDEFLFGKLIFLILIYLVIYVTIKKNDFFGDNETILKIITATISILAVRFIPDELVRVIFLQYSALGAAIGMIMPFIIILFFLHQSNFGPLPRKIGWFLYGLSYVSIFSYTYVDLTGMAGYIYWAGIIGIIVAFFMDRQIHAAFGDVKMKESRRGFEVNRITRFTKELKDAIDHRDSTPTPTPAVRRILEKRIAYITKEISKINKSL